MWKSRRSSLVSHSLVSCNPCTTGTVANVEISLVNMMGWGGLRNRYSELLVDSIASFLTVISSMGFQHFQNCSYYSFPFGTRRLWIIMFNMTSEAMKREEKSNRIDNTKGLGLSVKFPSNLHTILISHFTCNFSLGRNIFNVNILITQIRLEICFNS